MDSPPAGRRKRLALLLAIAGLMSLSYVLGAAAMYFEFPSQGFLCKAFSGGQAWLEQITTASGAAPHGDSRAVRASIDKPDKTFDGFTLYTNFRSSQALLINMHGETLHRWGIRFSEVWPEPSHVRAASSGRDYTLCFFACHLFPNGDLLGIFQSQGIDTPYGYGLVKLDKNSKVIWRYSACVHHAVDVADDGTICTLTQEILHQMPKGLEFIPTPCLTDYLVLLSPQGKELKKIPILEAFRDSPFGLLLTTLEKPPAHRLPQALAAPPGPANWKGDILHTNAVRVLRRQQAPAFPMFKAGQVLISVRELDVIAVLDIETRALVWASQGPWRRQHDPHFLDNGRLLIFDNLGSPRGSRVLEYHPATNALPWSYTNEDSAAFFTATCGMCQRLSNGNTLIVDSNGGQLLEVTAGKELVWSCPCHPDFIPSARRYGPERVQFLKLGPRDDP